MRQCTSLSPSTRRACRLSQNARATLHARRAHAGPREARSGRPAQAGRGQHVSGKGARAPRGRAQGEPGQGREGCKEGGAGGRRGAAHRRTDRRWRRTGPCTRASACSPRSWSHRWAAGGRRSRGSAARPRSRRRRRQARAAARVTGSRPAAAGWQLVRRPCCARAGPAARRARQAQDRVRVGVSITRALE